MSDQRPLNPRSRYPSSDPPSANAALSVTRADFDAIVRELDQLRRSHRDELARRLRDARTSGSPADDDDVLAVLEDVSVDRARIAHLEETIRTAAVVDAAFDGCAALGCVVRAADDVSQVTEFVLVGRRGRDAARHEVSPASPVGRALLGARPGDAVRVELPDGRHRTLRILEVIPADLAGQVLAGAVTVNGKQYGLVVATSGIPDPGKAPQTVPHGPPPSSDEVGPRTQRRNAS
jgi:transcription elongation factor GreA